MDLLSLLTNMGIVWRRTAYFTRALDAWENAWALAKVADEPKERAIADRALAELLELNARLGPQTFQIAGIHTVNQAGVRLAEQGHAGWRRVVQTVRHARGIRRRIVRVVELPELRSRRDVDCEHIHSVAARLVRRGEGREHGRVVAAEQRRLHRLAGSQVDVVELARGGPSRVAERGQVVVGGCAGGRGSGVVRPASPWSNG